MNLVRPLRFPVLVSLIVLSGACARQGSETTETSATHEGAPAETTAAVVAVATLAPTQGNSVAGTVSFTQEPGGVRVVADITGLTPGDHGFHIHANGDCSAPDASSAGDHYNPTAMQHGGPQAAQRHLGDLGNLTADASGTARIDVVDPHLSLHGENAIVGRAVIVHANPDDLTSQPAGNAGARVACGVIMLQ